MLSKKGLTVSFLLLFLAGGTNTEDVGNNQTPDQATPTPDPDFRNVCYPKVGCFDNTPPFDNANGKVPLSPTEIGAQFWLYTRSSAPNYEELFYTDKNSILNSSFNPLRKTKFLIHGFTSHIGKQYLHDMKNAFLDKGDFNVILVGWGEGAALPNYEQATANLRLIAKEVTLILDHMVDAGLDLSNVHLIGHSLGAHLAGDVGAFTKGKIGRISGLDPAEPTFENKSPVVRLDAGDAQFVDVLHTDSNKFNVITGGFGLNQASGHVDIFANGGQLQPGCHDTVTGFLDILTNLNPENLGEKVACSHNLAPQYYIESIKQSCTYTTYPCGSYEQFEKGECMTCKGGCSSMGYLADTMAGRGVHYINTKDQRPFCGKPYPLELTPARDQMEDNHGTIFMALVGDQGTGTFSQITPMNGLLSNKGTVQHIAMFDDVGRPKSVKVKFVQSDALFATIAKTFTINHIRVTDPDSGITYQSSHAVYKLRTDVEQDIALSPSVLDPVG